MDKTYRDFLNMPQWKSKRAVVLKRDRYKCRNCGLMEKLEIHHRVYIYSQISKEFILPWNYKTEYLITLCKYCHIKGHQKFIIPKIIK